MADTVKLREALEAARRIVDAYTAWEQGGRVFKVWEQYIAAARDHSLIVARALLASAKELGEGDSTLRNQSAEMLIEGLRNVSNARFAELKRAQAIIDGLKDYRERLLTCQMDIEPSGRARIIELATPPKDDYDRAVLLLAADHERLIRAVASEPVPKSASQGRDEVVEMHKPDSIDAWHDQKRNLYCVTARYIDPQEASEVYAALKNVSPLKHDVPDGQGEASPHKGEGT